MQHWGIRLELRECSVEAIDETQSDQPTKQWVPGGQFADARGVVCELTSA